MLDSIINLVKEQVVGAVNENADIPDDQKGAVAESTESALLSGLAQYMTPDNISAITNLFSGGGNSGNSQITNGVEGSVISELAEKIGLDKNVASSIASSIVPAVMGMMASKTQDDNEPDFNIESILGAFTGGNKGGGSPLGGLLGALGGLFGGKK